MASSATEREGEKLHAVPPLTVENILKAFQPVWNIWWTGGVGHCLVGREKRKELEVNHRSEEDGGWRALVGYWLHNGPHRSWRRLIWALDRAREIRAADTIRSYAEPLRDPTLTVERVSGVLEKVENSEWVELWLGVPDSKMKESTERERSCFLGEYWVNTHWDASWERLAGVLYHCEEKTALEEVVGKYLQTSRDPTLTISTIMEVMKGKERKWYDLGMWLDIPRSKQQDIRIHNNTDVQCMQASLDYWERTHPAPSWKLLAEALWEEEEYTLAEEVSTKYVRASEKTQEEFDHAMQYGHVNARNMTVLVNGAAGVGKTHAIAVIMNEPPPKVRRSTPCAEKPIRAISRSRVGVHGNEWRKVDENEFREMIADTAGGVTTAVASQHKIQHMWDPASETQQRQSHHVTAVATQHGVMPGTKKLTIPTPSTTKPTDADTHVVAPQQRSDTPLIQQKSSTKETLTQLMDRSIGRRRVFEVDWVNLIDSGGQPQFHEVLPMFLKNTSTCIPVLDLSEKLSDHHKVEYYDKSGKPVGEPYESALTNEETLRRCVRAIHSEATKGRCPNIAFLGTFHDMEDTCEEETRKQKNAKLLSMLSPEAREHVLYYGEGMDEVIFPFDAKHPGKEEQKIASDLRRLIIEKCSIEPEKIPLHWYALEVALQEMMEAKGRGVLSKVECRDLARTFQFNEKSFEAALKHLSSLNILLYYDSILPGTVFCDSQVLLDKVTELVEQKYRLHSYQFKTPQISTTAMDPKWLRFRDRGIVTLEILSDDCMKKHYVPGLFTPTDLIKLFKSLLIVAEVDKDQYLMPSLLPVADSQASSHPIPPLLLYFHDGGPRFGTFCALMAFLLSHAKWKLLLRSNSPARNSFSFRVPRGRRGDFYPGSITVQDSLSTYFQVSVFVPATTSSMVCPVVCPRIRDTILAGVRSASSKLCHTDSAPVLAFFCMEKGTSCPSFPHPATACKDWMSCTEKPEEVCNVLTKNHLLWFGPEDTTDVSATESMVPTSSCGVSSSAARKLGEKPTLVQLMMLRTQHREKVEIIHSIAPRWKDCGIFLDFDPEGQTVNLIEAEQKLNGPVACCQAMFQRWLQGHGRPATWEVLIEVLKDMEHMHLIEKMKNALNCMQ